MIHGEQTKITIHTLYILNNFCPQFLAAFSNSHVNVFGTYIPNSIAFLVQNNSYLEVTNSTFYKNKQILDIGNHSGAVFNDCSIQVVICDTFEMSSTGNIKFSINRKSNLHLNMCQVESSIPHNDRCLDILIEASLDSFVNISASKFNNTGMGMVYVIAENSDIKLKDSQFTSIGTGNTYIGKGNTYLRTTSCKVTVINSMFFTQTKESTGIPFYFKRSLVAFYNTTTTLNVQLQEPEKVCQTSDWIGGET